MQIATSLAAWAFAASSAASGASPVPLEHFFKLPAMSGAVVSPDGTKAALAIAGPNGQTAVAMVELANPKKVIGVAGIEGSGVAGIRWVNDRRVVFREVDFQRGIGDQTGYRLMAVNVDGTDFRRLVGVAATNKAREAPLPERYRLFGTLDDGSNDVLVSLCNWVEERGSSALGGYKCQWMLERLNTMTVGARPLTPTAPENASGWLADHRGEPRLMIGYERDRVVYHWRDGDSRWAPLADLDALDGDGLSWYPHEIGADGKLYVTANVGKSDGAASLTTLDLATGKPDPRPLVSIAGFDFRGELIWDRSTKKLVGVHYLADASGTVWLDEGMAAVQRQIDELLPGTINMIQCGRACLGARRLWVTTYSDLQPPVYFVYDRDIKKLEFVGASRPWIDAKRSASRELVRITARDGLTVPAHVTRPRDAKGPLPTVVLVHGGPYVDGDHWRWDADAQFLASRGYMVIEPDYRGTQRYGFKHFKAGWKQWGLAMQDDVTDVTHWAVKQGLADPKRLVIAGASYGGYATMMGLVREPELYRAGINWVGVTDILHWYNHPYSDLGDFGMRFYLPRMVGDMKKDRAQLEATSPVLQARQIKRPVLMVYGALDVRVPITHGRDMLAALKAQGTPVQWHEYAEEGHGWLRLENNVDFWTRVERFLAEHTK